MSGIVVVLVTCPNLLTARRLTNHLIKQRVAACVNIVPSVQSVFWWKGKIDRASEALLIIKTPARHFDRLKRAILSKHPYGVPEILALPVRAGHRPYLDWVVSSTRAARK